MNIPCCVFYISCYPQVCPEACAGASSVPTGLANHPCITLRENVCTELRLQEGVFAIDEFARIVPADTNPQKLFMKAQVDKGKDKVYISVHGEGGCGSETTPLAVETSMFGRTMAGMQVGEILAAQGYCPSTDHHPSCSGAKETGKTINLKAWLEGTVGTTLTLEYSFDNPLFKLALSGANFGFCTLVYYDLRPTSKPVLPVDSVTASVTKEASSVAVAGGTNGSERVDTGRPGTVTRSGGLAGNTAACIDKAGCSSAGRSDSAGLTVGIVLIILLLVAIIAVVVKKRFYSGQGRPSFQEEHIPTNFTNPMYQGAGTLKSASTANPATDVDASLNSTSIRAGQLDGVVVSSGVSAGVDAGCVQVRDTGAKSSEDPAYYTTQKDVVVASGGVGEMYTVPVEQKRGHLGETTTNQIGQGISADDPGTSTAAGRGSRKKQHTYMNTLQPTKKHAYINATDGDQADGRADGQPSSAAGSTQSSTEA